MEKECKHEWRVANGMTGGGGLMKLHSFWYCIKCRKTEKVSDKHWSN